MNEFIDIRGARENNLKDISVRIPKRQITIFTGVSGSGKSSIVFDTIATEAQRQAIVDQKRLGGGSHSTVGTITDIYTLLRLLFSRVGKPHVGYSNAFSFNDPQGMCRECNGLGKKLGVIADDFIDRSKSLAEGAVQVPFFASWEGGAYAASGLFDKHKKLSKFTKEEMDLLLHSKPRKVKMRFGDSNVNVTFMGVIEKIERSYVRRDFKTLSPRTQQKVAPYLRQRPCLTCKGARLSQAALGCKIRGRNIADLSAMEIGELLPVVQAITDPVGAPIVASLTDRLQHVVDIGLDYLTLNRETDTLSGGESQRIKMVKHLGSSLVDVMYIFDEPSVGLHPRDVHRLNELLQKLRDKGNTVIVVEHDPDVIKIANHVVDVGPQAGTAGGRVVFEGSYRDLVRADTLTATHLQQALPIKRDVRRPKGRLRIKNARDNNLQNISVDIPTGVLTLITGVAGSGKSSLINEAFLRQHPDAVVIDQSAVGTSTRSNPATYTGVMDDVRKVFAATNKVDASLFSFNSKGACENCNGSGVIYTDLAFLDGVKTPCEICHGRRFKDDVLAYKLNGKSISDVLALTVADALTFFTQLPILRKLEAMRDVGLHYLTLGQPLSTLSGGECQRIKMASELHKKGSVYILDEPTTGLHMSDVGHLLIILDRLVDGGNTVIVIEHNMDVVRRADWIIDLGPEGGSKGGRVVFEGSPTSLLKASESLTSRYLQPSRPSNADGVLVTQS